MKIILLFFILLSYSLSGVEFENLSGSDLMLGIGAREISLGGAGSLLENSPGSIYWNAAGLADIIDTNIQIDIESPWAVKNLILVINSKFFHLGSHRFTIGLARLNRLRILGESDEVWTGYAAYLLDLTMLDLSNFRGKVDSDTNDYRISFALEASEKLKLGITFLRLV